MVAYRYNPEAFKRCPAKYNYLKDMVFDGVEYTSSQACKNNKLPERWFPSINRYLKSIKYDFQH
jgi:hypothetical protein